MAVRSLRSSEADLDHIVDSLLIALHGIGVPRIFILIVGMAYRCIFLLLASEEQRTRHD